MNYSTAARKAINAFNQLSGKVPFNDVGLTIEKGAQFRKLTVLESSGTGAKLQHVLFELEFCDKNGENYRSVWIRCSAKESSLDLSTLQQC